MACSVAGARGSISGAGCRRGSSSGERSRPPTPRTPRLVAGCSERRLQALEEEVVVAAAPPPGRPQAGAPSRSACSRPRASSPRPSARTRSSPTPCVRRASTSPRCATRSTSSPSRRRPTARCSAPTTTAPSTCSRAGRKMRVAVHPDDRRRRAPTAAPRSCSTSRSTSCWPAQPERHRRGRHLQGAARRRRPRR